MLNWGIGLFDSREIGEWKRMKRRKKKKKIVMMVMIRRAEWR